MINNRHLFQAHLAQTSDFPLMLEIERGKGSFLYDNKEKSYLDLISGIGVSSIGHCHPSVIQAVTDQIQKHMHVMVYGEFVQSPQVQLASLLNELTPAPLDNVYLVNSGSEAVEASLKLAKRYTGKAGIVAFSNSYHGSTHGALSVCGNESLKQAYRPLLPGIKHFNLNDVDAIRHIDSQTAAVIIEPVQGEAGVHIADYKFLEALRNRCFETGALLIFDEIQSGIGRTGKFWAFEHSGVIPDIILSAKALGGGMPIGAVIASKEVMSVFKNNPILGHITTFGGHPVAAAAAISALNVIKNENLVAQVDIKAQRFTSRLIHPSIKSIRNLGLLMAVEFESFDQLKPIIDLAIQKGVITDWFLFCDNAMRIAPPLNISESEIDTACDIILEAIEEATGIH